MEKTILDEKFEIFKNKLIQDKSISTISKLIGLNDLHGIKTRIYFDENSKNKAVESFCEFYYEILTPSKIKNFFGLKQIVSFEINLMDLNFEGTENDEVLKELFEFYKLAKKNKNGK